jgi:hypothetical protein
MAFDMQSPFKFFAMDNQHAFYVFNSNTVTAFTGPTLETIDESRFNTLGDKIIASNFYDGNLIFFSLNHGILRTKDNSLRLSIDEESSFTLGNRGDQSIDNSYLVGNSLLRGSNNTPNQNFSQYNPDLSNVSMQSLDDMSFNFNKTSNRQATFDFTFSNMASGDQLNLTRLKEAFQCYLKKEERDSQELIEELLQACTDRKVDYVCVELSEKLIDDIPAHDPRWAELNSKSKSLNTNLIISNQLKGKIRLHEYFVTFLKKFQLWDKV